MHLRTWFLGRDGRWRPTRRGVTLPPEQLEQLEAGVRAARKAYLAGVLGPPAAAASTARDPGDGKPDTLPPA